MGWNRLAVYEKSAPARRFKRRAGALVVWRRWAMGYRVSMPLGDGGAALNPDALRCGSALRLDVVHERLGHADAVGGGAHDAACVAGALSARV